MIDDRQLLQKAHAGHEASARELWARHASSLLAYARSIVGVVAAEDVVQAVFCRTLEFPAHQVAGVHDVRGWLVASVRHEALNCLRGLRRRSARTARLHHPPAAPAPGDDIEELRHAIDGLPRRLREPVILKHIAGMTFDQIAIATGVNRNTISSRYQAALATLRRMLELQESATEAAHV